MSDGAVPLHLTTDTEIFPAASSVSTRHPRESHSVRPGNTEIFCPCCNDLRRPLTIALAKTVNGTAKDCEGTEAPRRETQRARLSPSNAQIGDVVNRAMRPDDDATQAAQPSSRGELNAFLEEHFGSLTTELSALQHQVSAIRNELNSYSYELSICRNGSSSSAARSSVSRAMTTRPPFAKLVESVELGIIDHMRYLMIAAITSFAHAEPAIAGSWISDQTRSAFRNEAYLFHSVPGLTLIFFTAPSGTPNRYNSPTALAWSMLMRWTVARKIILASDLVVNGARGEITPPSLFPCPTPPSAPRQPPVWMRASKGATQLYVHAFISEIEKNGACRAWSTPEAADDPVRKRRRIEVELADESHSAEKSSESKAIAQQRKAGVRLARRSTTMRSLNNGRTRARVELFENLLFVLDKIRSYPDPSRAREAGFDILFHSGIDTDLAAESLVSSPDSRWDVPLTKLAGASDAKKENEEKHVALGRMFLEFWVEIRYEQTVLRDGYIAPEDDPDFYKEDLTLSAKRNVNLLHLATRLLEETFKLGDFWVIMSASSLTLRCALVFAIGLLGSLRRSMGYSITPIESNCCGPLTADAVPNGDFGYTLMYGDKSKDREWNADKASEIGRYRDAAFVLRWPDFVKERSKPADIRLESRSSPSDELVLDDDWAANAGNE